MAHVHVESLSLCHYKELMGLLSSLVYSVSSLEMRLMCRPIAMSTCMILLTVMSIFMDFTTCTLRGTFYPPSGKATGPKIVLNHMVHIYIYLLCLCAYNFPSGHFISNAS